MQLSLQDFFSPEAMALLLLKA
uniref:Uncharacterized protein n=1 Tax=Arundo donax TaxID=35708 RepID=A0A0A8ZDD5_ARUDO